VDVIVLWLVSCVQCPASCGLPGKEGRKRKTKTRKVSLSSVWREIQVLSGLKLRSKSEKANYELGVRGTKSKLQVETAQWGLPAEGLEMSRLHCPISTAPLQFHRHIDVFYVRAGPNKTNWDVKRNYNYKPA